MAVIFDIKGKKILFLHIPKNAGRSIISCIQKFKIKDHPGHLSLKQVFAVWGENYIRDIDMILYSRRDPLSRAVSIYNYFRNTPPSETGHRLEHWYFKSNSFEASMRYLYKQKADEKKLSKSCYGEINSFLSTQNQKDYIDTSFLKNDELKNHIDKKIFYIDVQNIQYQMVEFLKFLKVEEEQIKEVTKILSEVQKTSESIKTQSFNLNEKELKIVKQVYEKDFDFFDNPITKLWRLNEF